MSVVALLHLTSAVHETAYFQTLCLGHAVPSQETRTEEQNH